MADAILQSREKDFEVQSVNSVILFTRELGDESRAAPLKKRINFSRCGGETHLLKRIRTLVYLVTHPSTAISPTFSILNAK